MEKEGPPKKMKMKLTRKESFVIHKKWFIDSHGDKNVRDIYDFGKKVLITFSNIEYIQALGEGTYGSVHKAVHK